MVLTCNVECQDAMRSFGLLTLAEWIMQILIH